MLKNKDEVIQQYCNDSNLAKRISIHELYSENPKGFYHWLFEQYELKENDKILELGCGNGMQWKKQMKNLPKACSLTLSDFSRGMVEKVQLLYGEYDCVDFVQIDAHQIPYPDHSFDCIIANHMLYHVEDIQKVLMEVYRVLKENGVFYASTNNQYGLRHYINQSLVVALGKEDQNFSEEISFHSGNGEKILSQFYPKVNRIDYKDSLLIPKSEILIDWMKSSIGTADYTEQEWEFLDHYFKTELERNQCIVIAKDSVLFIAKKKDS